MEIINRKHTEDALRESEEKYRLLFENELMAVVIMDGETLCFEDVNPATLQLFGYSKEEFSDLSIEDIFVAKEEILSDVRKAVKGEADGQPIVLRYFKKKDGTTFQGELSTGTFTSNDRKKVIGAVRDISSQIQAEEEKEKIESQLFQAQKMKSLGTLVAGMAHEINNPVNSILLNAPLLQRIWKDVQPLLKENNSKKPGRKYGGLTYDFLKENLGQLLSDIEMSADRIAKIVTNLKNFASPSDTIEMRPTNINAAVENAAHLAQTTARKSGVDLDLDLDDELPIVEGHAQSVEQITLNLIINSMEAIDHDQGKIKVKTGFQQKSERVRISVADNGHGVNPDISDNIFDPFVTDKQAEGGTGLGLSVTYNLVHALNGEITFKSQRGKGSTFNLFFPTSIKMQQPSILVVDDDDMIRDIIVQRLLKDRTFKIEEASDGLEALVKLESNPPELLILDIFMPGMDGLEVCRVIKNNPDLSEMKVIIITGFPEHTMLRSVSELGFSNIYAKPIDLRKLGNEVDRMLLEG